MGDRHMLLVWLREVPRHILDGILAQPHDPADWPVYDCDTNGVEEVGS
jgi:hypothetical protein